MTHRVIFTIPHYFNTSGAHTGSTHGSQNERAYERRKQALCDVIQNIVSHFGSIQCSLSHAQRAAVPRPYPTPALPKADIVLCVIKGFHLAHDLPESLKKWVRIVEHDNLENPKHLGFKTHEHLINAAGLYDYYAYTEDDLIIRDPQFFIKLDWFYKKFGNRFLLSPNRYELSLKGPIPKVYIDGKLANRALRNLTLPPSPAAYLKTDCFARDMVFYRASNPHSGCFFLNNTHIRTWKESGHYGQAHERFISPLESAAGADLFELFPLVKPHLKNPDFLEIEHAGESFSRQVGGPNLPFDERLKDQFGDRFSYRKLGV